jgi:hypothetical protein
MLAMIAMGGTACSQVSGGPIDACTLISTRHASVILGASVTARHVGPRPSRASEGSECVYSTGRAGGGFMLIAARPGFDDAKTEATAQMQIARHDQPPPGVPGITVRAVDGPGQAAYLGTSSGSTQLHVLDHGVSLVVSINQPDSPAVRARARQLAQAALDGLGHE